MVFYFTRDSISFDIDKKYNSLFLHLENFIVYFIYILNVFELKNTRTSLTQYLSCLLLFDDDILNKLKFDGSRLHANWGCLSLSLTVHTINYKV